MQKLCKIQTFRIRRICITALTVVLTMLSTTSPVYAAENIVFHMSFYVHNWRGNVTSLDFYDGADATEEEQEPSDAPDSEQISAVVIEEITSEQTSDLVDESYAEEISIITTEDIIEETETQEITTQGESQDDESYTMETEE